MGRVASSVEVPPVAGGDRRFARAATTVWVVVNLVALLQAVGFASRGSVPEVQTLVGVVIALLAVPATLALVDLVRVRAGLRWYAGPMVFDAFVVMLVVVDYLMGVEFRSPSRPALLVPFLVLFFGSIVLMGAPMFRVDRRRWLVTVASTVLLVAAMLQAMGRGLA